MLTSDSGIMGLMVFPVVLTRSNRITRSTLPTEHLTILAFLVLGVLLVVTVSLGAMSDYGFRTTIILGLSHRL